MARDNYILIDRPSEDGSVIIVGGEFNHLCNVLRAREGFRFIGFDGFGNGWRIEVVKRGSKSVKGQVIEPLPVEPDPYIELTIAVGCVRSSRMNWAVEKAAELGVRRFIPLITGFSVVDPGGGRLIHWRSVALSATKQSRRLHLMEITQPKNLRQVLKEVDPRGSIWALDNSEGSITSAEAIQSLKMPALLTIFIGPEGGFTTEEMELFKEHNIPRITMGNKPLRTETAVVVIVGSLVNSLQDYRGRVE